MNIFWGGTLFSDAEALDGVSSGAVNMTALGHMPHLATLNYLAFPSFAPGGPKAALDYFDTLMFKDPETSALIQQEAADNGIIYLNVLAGGANAFCTTYEFTDLDSMISGSKSFGNMDAAIFEKMGFQVTSVGPGDCYDALQRGLIDSTQMGLAPMVSMGWEEVASYWALDGTYTAGNMFTANLDWWNSLTDAQRRPSSRHAMRWRSTPLASMMTPSLPTALPSRRRPATRWLSCPMLTSSASGLLPSTLRLIPQCRLLRPTVRLRA